MSEIYEVLVGVSSSLVAWWFLSRFLSPKLSFSKEIVGVALKGNKGSTNYLMKFKNTKRRAIIDLDVKAYINVKTQEINIPEDGRNIYVNLSVSKIPKLGGGMSTGVTIHPEKTEEFISGSMFGYLESSEDGVSMEDIMQMPEFDGLYFVVFGYDDFSGARKLFKSKPYFYEDLS